MLGSHHEATDAQLFQAAASSGGKRGPTGLEQGLSFPWHTSAHCSKVSYGISATQIQQQGVEFGLRFVVWQVE